MRGAAMRGARCGAEQSEALSRVECGARRIAERSEIRCNTQHGSLWTFGPIEKRKRKSSARGLLREKAQGKCAARSEARSGYEAAKGGYEVAKRNAELCAKCKLQSTGQSVKHEGQDQRQHCEAKGLSRGLKPYDHCAICEVQATSWQAQSTRPASGNTSGMARPDAKHSANRVG